MGKYYLRMDQEIQVYFIINPDLVGNGQGLHYRKRNILGLFLGSCETLFNESESLPFIFTFRFQYFSKRESTF